MGCQYDMTVVVPTPSEKQFMSSFLSRVSTAPSTTIGKPPVVISLVLRLGTREGQGSFAPKELTWEVGGGPGVFISCILNQCPGDMARLLLEPVWIVSIGDYSSAGLPGESDYPSWGHNQWGSLSHHSLRTNWNGNRHVLGMKNNGRGIPPMAAFWNIHEPRQWVKRGRRSWGAQVMVWPSQRSSALTAAASIGHVSFVSSSAPRVKLCFVVHYVNVIPQCHLILGPQPSLYLPSQEEVWGSQELWVCPFWRSSFCHLFGDCEPMCRAQSAGTIAAGFSLALSGQVHSTPWWHPKETLHGGGNYAEGI